MSSMPSPLRLGVLTPSSNTALEPLTSAIVAGLPGASAHFARFRVTEISLKPQALDQFDDSKILQAAQLLADARVDVIGWSGTSAGWLGFDSDQRLIERIHTAGGHDPAGRINVAQTRRQMAAELDNAAIPHADVRLEHVARGGHPGPAHHQVEELTHGALRTNIWRLHQKSVDNEVDNVDMRCSWLLFSKDRAKGHDTDAAGRIKKRPRLDSFLLGKA